MKTKTASIKNTHVIVTLINIIQIKASRLNNWNNLMQVVMDISITAFLKIPPECLGGSQQINIYSTLGAASKIINAKINSVFVCDVLRSCRCIDKRRFPILATCVGLLVTFIIFLPFVR